jgi:hypothetical protein
LVEQVSAFVLLMYRDCPYQKLFLIFSTDPTSSVELCSLYCQIQIYYGFMCIPNPTTTTTTIPPTTTTVTEITTTITLEPCPSQYVDDPESRELCQLWTQLKELQHQLDNSTSTTAGLTSISCPYRYGTVYIKPN